VSSPTGQPPAEPLRLRLARWSSRSGITAAPAARLTQRLGDTH
jgi:hypothetical protein